MTGATATSSPQGTVARDAGPSGEDRSLWVFVLADMTVFALFFVVLLVERRADRAGFAEAARDLVLPIGLANTVVLLTGSYLVVLATAAHREGATGRAAALRRAATATAALFVLLKIVEYGTEVVGGLSGSPTFVALYAVVTGLHLLHVVVGTVLLVRWRGLARRGTPWERSARFTGAAAIYWHMVDLLWIVILSLVYLVGRAP